MLPGSLRLALVFVAALFVAGQVNRLIYALALLQRRSISPWQRRDPKTSPRRVLDYLPIVGWWSLRREELIHGKGFWLRPMLIEFLLAFGLMALYQFETNDGLLPQRLAGIAAAVPAEPPLTTHLRFVAHALLICLMTVATFIDFDEQMIPDEVTVVGTLLGLILVASLPALRLPIVLVDFPPPPAPPALLVEPLQVTSPLARPEWLDGSQGLALGLALYAGWCAALVPATSTLRRGWQKGATYYFASIVRHRTWPFYVGLLVVGGGGILAVSQAPLAHWRALLDALCGMAIGGCVVWAVRIAGRLALKKEAMGFGDVTLMGMIGAFFGWQPCLLIFFLSPVAAVIIAVTQAILTGRRDIAFGPYLCLAAIFVLVGWGTIWHEYAEGIFALGWFLPAALGVCLSLMMGLLMLWKILEELFWPT
jgi:prepilin signal peptidase PulO-like enzyme (type II secretory pathway)